MKQKLFVVSSSILLALSVSVSAARDDSLQSRNACIEKRAEEIVPFLSEAPCCVGRPITDRAAWDALGNDPAFRSVVKDAEKLMTTPIPELPESLYKEFYRNGNRSRYQTVRNRKYRRIATLVRAECVENKGRFLPPLEETIRSICNDPSWVLPAHDSQAEIYDGKTMYVDLTSADTSVELALTLLWLGERLSPEIRKTVRENIERRTFAPYESTVKTGEPKRNWWVKTTNNWNSVCHAGVVGAALALVESPRRRAWYVASAEHFMEPFFKGFTPDGYCSEGMGYWNYGFGHFVQLSEIVCQATGGKVDFMTMPKVRNCSLFAPRMEVAPGQFAAFADCSVTARPDSLLMNYLNRRFRFGYDLYEKKPDNVGSLKSIGVYRFPNAATATPPAPSASTPLDDPRTLFPDAGVLICRPLPGADPKTSKQLAFVCKGGHNAEHHNHNDVGSFTVMYAGGMPVLDPGGEVYTRRTFGKDRYVGALLNSYGHPVPVVNGRLQKTGRKAAGKIVLKNFSDEKDVFEIDYASAYGQKEIKELSRTFEYARTAPGTANRLIVKDRILLEPAGTFEAALLTYDPWKQDGGNGDDGRLELRIGSENSPHAIRVLVTASDGEKPLALEWEAKEIEEDAMSWKKPVRFGFKIKENVTGAEVVMTIVPD